MPKSALRVNVFDFRKSELHRKIYSKLISSCNGIFFEKGNIVSLFEKKILMVYNFKSLEKTI